MSPARARTSDAAIVTAGRELLEAGGLDAVTMLAVADRVGVRAPSLYKRIRGRGALIVAVTIDVLEDLERRLAPFSRDPDPGAGLRALGVAFRTFAHANPRGYALLFQDLPPDARVSADRLGAAAAPVVDLAQRLVGPEQALEAARVITAFAHGFVSMELAGAFRLGGSVDDAFRYGLDTLVATFAADRPPADGPRKRKRGRRT
ncbi:MAG TPA: TetR/AcrR family transcriptional regulator [Candidatus Limnocylindrales bacterium]